MSGLLLEDRQESLLKLTFNRPEKRNALSRELLGLLRERLAAAAEDPAIRVIVLTGAGPAFCAGLDLIEVRAAVGDPGGHEQLILFFHDTLELIRKLAKPVIAAVNGHAVAGGAAVMSACDIVVCSEFARIGYPEIRQGLAAAVVMPDLLRQVGQRRAKYLLLTGETIAAEEAKAIGLVDEVVAPADLMARAGCLASTLATSPPEALRLTKQWILQSQFLQADELRDHARRFHGVLDES